ncbi:methylmalonyl-CoA mutase family protein [Pararhizobium mangrovi]|uniref:Methylmalonyl-CoA mutase n=1 Tax=Pararhizobium mangrovi TaxID=2590452 RepID=A0A506U2T3_9HYPH|nr:methylmalonyl-CoA mutase family protein [Pararhizobium mangrovi]TPW27581.1 methylmalonyl-CoA mutase [Pararhizobium mangrovi]
MDSSVIDNARFEPIDEAGWRALAERALKGADFDEALTTRTDDGISYGPIHTRRGDTRPLPRRNAGRPWHLAQRIDDPETVRAAAQAKEDTANGAQTLVLAVGGAPTAYGFGLAQPVRPALARILEEVDPGTLALRLEGSAMAGRALADLLARTAHSPGEIEVHFGLDPVSAAASTARDFSLTGELARFAEDLADPGFGGTVLTADGRIAHNAGASEAQELGFVAAALVAMLRAAEDGGMAPETLLAMTGLAVSVDQQQMLGIAKIRALRLLHARIASACGVGEAAPVFVHAETSLRMATREDPETNILRNTLAAFAAGIGGADSIAVLPHTIALGLPDGAARRIARNTQLVLLRESHLARVADPAAGAGGIEMLTDALANAAWAEFQTIEREGGIMASLAGGHVQERIRQGRAARTQAIREGKRPIIGTTHYRPDAPRPVAVLAEREPEPSIPRGSRRALTLAPLHAGIEETHP